MRYNSYRNRKYARLKRAGHRADVLRKKYCRLAGLAPNSEHLWNVAAYWDRVASQFYQQAHILMYQTHPSAL